MLRFLVTCWSRTVRAYLGNLLKFVTTNNQNSTFLPVTRSRFDLRIPCRALAGKKIILRYNPISTLWPSNRRN